MPASSAPPIGLGVAEGVPPGRALSCGTRGVRVRVAPDMHVDDVIVQDEPDARPIRNGAARGIRGQQAILDGHVRDRVEAGHGAVEAPHALLEHDRQALPVVRSGRAPHLQGTVPAVRDEDRVRGPPEIFLAQSGWDAAGKGLIERD